MSDSLCWGILGTGNIARSFARGLAASRTGKLVAVGSRSQAPADKFGEEFRVPRRHASYEALLADPRGAGCVHLDAPSRCTPSGPSKPLRLRSTSCAKSRLDVNFAEAMAIVEAARANDVFLMEAFMYRCHPQMQKLVELSARRRSATCG